MDGITGLLLGVSAVIASLMPVVLWQLARIHTIVNSNYTKLTRRVDQLTAALIAEGKPVPETPEERDTS